MSPHPHIIQTQNADAIVMSLVGEFDIAGTDLLQATFREAITATDNKLVVDLAATTFLDSMALGAIVGAGRRTSAWGGWLRLVAPPPNIRRVLRITELDTVFGLYDTVDQAVTHQPIHGLTLPA